MDLKLLRKSQVLFDSTVALNSRLGIDQRTKEKIEGKYRALPPCKSKEAILKEE